MTKVLLITNPADDPTMDYLDAWSEKVKAAAISQGNIKIVEKRNKDVIKSEVEAIIIKEDPDFVLFNGHGESDRIEGFARGVLVRCGDNEALLKNKIIYSLACSAGLVLAPELIRHGSKAYIGYRAPFKFTGGRNKTTNHDRQMDAYAAYTLDPAYKVVLSLIEGKTAQESFQDAQDLYKTVLGKLATTYDPNLKFVYSRVFFNFQHHVKFGDDNARF